MNTKQLPALATALQYLRTGWTHFYLVDVRQAFVSPEVEDISMIPATMETLEIIMQLIERQFAEFQSAITQSGEANGNTTGTCAFHGGLCH